MKIAKFSFSLFGINTYVVYDAQGGECAIIDPGMITNREREALQNFISREGLKVTHLINTHLHIDHAIGDSFVAHQYGVLPEAGAADAPLGRKLSAQGRMFGIEEVVSDVEIYRELKAGDVVKVGQGALNVIAVPGHSPGSVALYDKEGGYVIVGDALFAGSIGRTDLEGGDYATLINSIKEGLLALPPDTVVYPGHGPATTIAREQATNPFLR